MKLRQPGGWAWLASLIIMCPIYLYRFMGPLKDKTDFKVEIDSNEPIFRWIERWWYIPGMTDAWYEGNLIQYW